MSFEVLVDTENVQVCSGPDASLFGTIWVNMDGLDFPSSGWTDFIGAVIGSACSAFKTIAVKGEDQFSYFFDGPFYIYYSVESASKNTCYVEANIDGGPGGEVVCRASGYYDMRDIVTAFAKASEQILRDERLVEADGAGVSALRIAHEELKELARRLT